MNRRDENNCIYDLYVIYDMRRTSFSFLEITIHLRSDLILTTP